MIWGRSSGVSLKSISLFVGFTPNVVSVSLTNLRGKDYEVVFKFNTYGVVIFVFRYEYSLFYSYR
jgi:hypothetical protein